MSSQIAMAMERKVSQGIWENPELQKYIIPHLVPTDEKLGEKDGSYGFAKKVSYPKVQLLAKSIENGGARTFIMLNLIDAVYIAYFLYTPGEVKWHAICC